MKNTGKNPISRKATPPPKPPKAPKPPKRLKAQKIELTDKEKQRKRKAMKRKTIIAAFAIICIATVSFTFFYNSIKAPTQTKEISSLGGGTKPNIGQDKNKRAGVYSFLIMATDKNSVLTDAIVVASMDTENGTLSAMNIPRDTMSNVKRSVKKINSAYSSGINQSVKEVEMLMGFKPDKTIVISLQAIEEIVDALGGVEYDVPFRMKYDDPTQDLHIDLQPGIQKLNGKQTVHFMRWRKNNRSIKGGYAEGDIGRIKGQQEFMQALASKLMTPTGLLKMPKVIKVAFDNIKTDLTLGEMVWLGKEGIKIGSENLNLSILPGYSKTVDSLSYFIPDEKNLLEVVNNYFNPYINPITDLDIVDVSKTTSTKPNKVPTKNPEEDDLPDLEIKPDTKPDTSTDNNNNNSTDNNTNANPDENTENDFPNVDSSVLE